MLWELAVIDGSCAQRTYCGDRRMKRTVFQLLLMAVAVAILLGGCQPVQSPAHGSYTVVGPLIGNTERPPSRLSCTTEVRLPLEFAGTIEGTALARYVIGIDGPCGSATSAFRKPWSATGTFSGLVDQRPGGFDFQLSTNIQAGGLITGQLAVIPGTGVGELANLRALLTIEGLTGRKAVGYSGSYFFEPSISDAQARRAFDATAAAKVEARIQDLRSNDQVPGLALAVIERGELVYLKGFGSAEIGTQRDVTPNTIFCLASVAKTVTSLAIMQLADEGKLALDSPVTEYLPYFALADKRYKEITIRHLLSHTSGLPVSADAHPSLEDQTNTLGDDELLERYIRSVDRIVLASQPGTAWAYSSLGYDILGDVVAKVSGMRFEEYVRRRIFLPLGMTHTTFAADDMDPTRLARPHVAGDARGPRMGETSPFRRIHAPSSYLYSSALDMARYLSAHLNRGTLDGVSILATSAYTGMWTPTAETWFTYPIAAQYGLGWMMGEYNGYRVIGHLGIQPGYNAFIALIPQRDAAVVVLANYAEVSPATSSTPAIVVGDLVVDLLTDTAGYPDQSGTALP